MQQTYEITNVSGSPSVGIRLIFALTRTVVEDVSLNKDFSKEISGIDITSPQRIEINWSGALDVKKSIAITVSFEGEPLSLIESIFITDEDSSNVSFNYITNSREALSINQDRVTYPEVIGDPKAVFHLRALAIEKTINPLVQRYQKFFYDFDFATNPALYVNNPELSEAESRIRRGVVLRVASLLTKRVLSRVDVANVNSDPPIEVTDKRDIEYLSHIQSTVIKKHFLKDTFLDTTDIFTAFEMFANGELRVQTDDGIWNSEPDSAFEFSFAEFAFVAVEREVDQVFWESIAPALVASQPIFTEVYAPKKKMPYRYTDYSSKNYDEARQVDDVFKSKCREAVKGITLKQLTDLAGAYARSAFPLGL